MKELLKAIKYHNLNYVANNLRFVEFTMEEYTLALNASPTVEMTACIVKGARIKESIPYHKLSKVCLKGDFTELGRMLDTHQFSNNMLDLILELSTESMVKRMLKLAIDKNNKQDHQV